jgi:hypothetical protein|tara:strand:- start:276 stop:1001 length:726 start_codon:yes stop_codon:yes gene_type:complete
MSAKKQSKDKRACIDCHFLTLLQIGGEHYEYPDLDVIPSVIGSNQVPLSFREQIKKKEDLTFESPFDGNDYLLGCYEECWSELQPDTYKKRYKTVVETSRNDCIFFFENNPDMNLEAGRKTQERKLKIKPQQEVMSVETTLSYNKTTGKFRFGNDVSMAISKTQRTRVRNIAEKLMKCWKEGEPCPQDEIVKNPIYKTPQGVHDDISTIRGILESLNVNMPQCTIDGYPPPSEPEHFNIEK